MTIFFCTTTFQSIGNGPSKFAQILLELIGHKDVNFHLFTEDVEEADTTDHIHKVNLSARTQNSKFGMISRIPEYSDCVLKFSKNIIPDVIVFNNAIIGYKLYKQNIPCLGMINDYNAIDISIKRSGLSYQYIRSRIFRYFEKYAVKNATGIISNSELLTQKIIKGYKAPYNKIHKLYKAINTDVKPIETKVITGDVSILFVKSDFKSGGLKDLIEASNLIDRNISLHIVGPTSSSYSKIKNYNKNYNTTLIFHGRLSQASIFSLMQKCDIFCTPARLEALGVANMEALIHKLPVVYTNVGGIPEVMNYGENGFEAEASNPISLSIAITNCITSELERKGKVEKGEEFIKKFFNKDIMLHNFISICSKVRQSG